MTLKEVGDETLRILEAESGEMTDESCRRIMKLYSAAFDDFFGCVSEAQLPFVLAMMRLLLGNFEAVADEDEKRIADEIAQAVTVICTSSEDDRHAE